MRGRRSWLVWLTLVVALLWSPSVSLAAIRGRIVENVGVKTAKLGLHDSVDARRIGGSYRRTRDDSYAGQTVYQYQFGKKSGGHYGLLMYSKADRHVFTFEIYSTALVTKNGTHVGTAASTLRKRYGTKLKSSTGPVYTRYYMGTRQGLTEFFVRDQRVHHIVISRY